MMDIRSCYCIFVYCVIIIQDAVTKTFSLNEAIATETHQKQESETSLTPKLPETTAERFSVNKALAPKSLLKHKFKDTERLFLRSKKSSPFKYRKTFQITTPLKPKKLKHSPKQRYRRRNQSIKREINGNDKLNQKYIPLLKSIGMLFDNLLDRDTSNSYEIPSLKQKRNRLKSVLPEETNRVVCKCEDKSEIEYTQPRSTKATVVIPDFRATTSVGTEDISTVETAATTTNYTTVSDVSRLRQYKDLSPLLPRNPLSSWRNHNGVSERSSTAYNRSTERDFTRDYGNSQHTTGFGENESNTQYNEEIAYSTTRDSSSGDRTNGGEFGNGKANSDTEAPSTNTSTDNKENEDTPEDFGFATKFKREDNMETGGNQTKSAKLLPELVRRLRGHISEDNGDHNTELEQSKEIYTESIFNDAHDNASHKRITYRSRPITKENQKIRSGNETMMIINGSPVNQNHMNLRNHINKAPVVMIIDGYSVTRNKHGENKLTKKSIHFQP